MIFCFLWPFHGNFQQLIFLISLVYSLILATYAIFDKIIKIGYNNKNFFWAVFYGKNRANLQTAQPAAGIGAETL